VLVIEERMTKARTTSPLTRNQKKKMSEVPSEVKLRKIVPEVPQDETEKGEVLRGRCSAESRLPDPRGNPDPNGKRSRYRISTRGWGKRF
jgi:hypothetical protein